MSSNLHFDLSHFGIIQISGDDATDFLQNQLITDLSDLETAGWLLSGWCSAKGRLLANFIFFKKQNDYFLILPCMLKETIIKRLKMFVLRSKVNVEDASENYALIGLSGSNTSNVLKQIYPDIEHCKNQSFNDSALLLLNDTDPRWLLMLSMNESSRVMNQILMAFEESDRATWSLLDIQAGIPWITASTTEQFIPQMLNLDQTGGLSFQKGCYPGQEIIARLHYRTEVKQRLFLGSVQTNVMPGPSDQLESVSDKRLLGTIIDAEFAEDSKSLFLVVANKNITELSDDIRIRGGNTIDSIEPLGSYNE